MGRRRSREAEIIDYLRTAEPPAAQLLWELVKAEMAKRFPKAKAKKPAAAKTETTT